MEDMIFILEEVVFSTLKTSPEYILDTGEMKRKKCITFSYKQIKPPIKVDKKVNE
jgi:hypothetical protein